MQLFWLWVEAVVPGENPQIFMEKMQIQYIKILIWVWTEDLCTAQQQW